MVKPLQINAAVCWVDVPFLSSNSYLSALLIPLNSAAARAHQRFPSFSLHSSRYAFVFDTFISRWLRPHHKKRYPANLNHIRWGACGFPRSRIRLRYIIRRDHRIQLSGTSFTTLKECTMTVKVQLYKEGRVILTLHLKMFLAFERGFFKLL